MNTGKTLFAQHHGLPAMDYFHRGSSYRYGTAIFAGPDAFLRRAIPVHGLRPADLPGKPAQTSRPASRSHASKLYHMRLPSSRSGARR